MEICNQCSCSCKPVSAECITRYSDITDPTILHPNHYQKATDNIDDLLGIDCAEELCSALEATVEALEADGDPDKTIEDFLEDKWLNVINNRHFKKWYSNRLLWHWLHGASISELSASGLVSTSNTDDSYKDNYTLADETERRRMQDSAEFYSSEAKSKFLSTYWYKNINLYDCAELECGCTKHYKCKQHCPPKKGIGMNVI